MVAQALSFANWHHVRAWFASADAEFVVLGTFRNEDVES
jgi:hypothetical protein